MSEYTFELFDKTHRMRVEGHSFGSIAATLFAEHEFLIERRGLAKKYHYYSEKYGVEPVVEEKQSRAKNKNGGRKYYPRERKQAEKTVEDVRRSCLMHLIDLVRNHGELVTNRVTGEIVCGGYPNVSIPDVGTPRFVNAYSYHGSLSGSQAALCAESAK